MKTETIPEGWSEVILENLTTKIRSGGTPTSTDEEYYSGNIPFVIIEDITKCNKYLKTTKKHITNQAITSCSTWIVPKYSILYTIYATLGDVCINKVAVTTNQAILNIIPNNKINLEYFYYWLKWYKQFIHHFTSQTTQSNLNAEIVKNFSLIIPSLSKEQEKIVAILKRIDETIFRTEDLIEKHTSIKIGLMQDLFASKRGWDEKEVEQLVSITTGGKDTQDAVDNGKYPFYVRSDTIERINSYSFDGEAILTSGDGVGVGKIYHYVTGKFDFHQRVYMLFNFKSEIHPKYLFEYFKAYFYNEVAKYSAKTTVDSVRYHMIAEMKVPIPKDYKEQEKIADVLEEANKKIESEQSNLDKLIKIKTGLMQDLLTGKVRVKV